MECEACGRAVWDDGSCGCPEEVPRMAAWSEPERCYACGWEIGMGPTYVCGCTCRECGLVLGAPADRMERRLCACCAPDIEAAEAPAMDALFERTVGELREEYPPIREAC